jgi:hypothetical protein
MRNSKTNRRFIIQTGNGITPQNDQLGGDIMSILSSVAPHLLPLLYDILKKPASQIGEYLGKQVKTLTGNGYNLSGVHHSGSGYNLAGQHTNYPGEGPTYTGGGYNLSGVHKNYRGSGGNIKLIMTK